MNVTVSFYTIASVHLRENLLNSAVVSLGKPEKKMEVFF